MKLLIISFSFDDEAKSVNEQLVMHSSTDGLLSALQAEGVEVECCKRFRQNAFIEKNGIRYFFQSDGHKGNPPFWFPAWYFIRLALSRKANIIHIQGLHFPLQTFLLKLLSTKQTKIVVQHHDAGNREKGIKRWIKRKLLSIADAFFFTTKEQGMAWFSQDINERKIFTVIEGASNMKRGNKEQALANLGLKGEFRFVWIGRLNSNKDPLTVLAGFELFCKEFSASKLFMIFQKNDLLEEVKSAINQSSTLSDSVVLVGKCNSIEIEQYLHATDYFVLGSHYEGSGYALSEAIACGCIPIVTDIPSFRMMTNNAGIGALWEPSNAISFYEALKKTVIKNKGEESDNCVAFYLSTLSNEAIARISIDHYKALSSITEAAV